MSTQSPASGDYDGHICTPRERFKSDPWWNEERPRTRWEAWEYIVHLAAYQPFDYQTAYGVVHLDRGEVLVSIRRLARELRWTVKRVRVWLRSGQFRARARAQGTSEAGTVYLIINYDYEQSGGRNSTAQKGTPKGTVEGSPGAHVGHKNKQLSSKASTNGASDEAERETTRPKGNDYPPEFEACWDALPKRANNPKDKCYRAWVARRREGLSAEFLLERAAAYGAYIAANGIEPRYVKQGATFYGPGGHLDADYSVTPNTANVDRAAQLWDILAVQTNMLHQGKELFHATLDRLVADGTVPDRDAFLADVRKLNFVTLRNSTRPAFAIQHIRDVLNGAHDGPRWTT